jgi:hypothetical protein
MRTPTAVGWDIHRKFSQLRHTKQLRIACNDTSNDQ